MLAAFRKPDIEAHLQSERPSSDRLNHELGGSVFATHDRGPDRRHDPRRRVLKGALIVFNGGHCTLGCQILDVSETGALVRPSDIFLCPVEFVLQPRVGPPRDCEVVWRKAETVGVRFI
jgi:hypothetical protein